MKQIVVILVASIIGIGGCAQHAVIPATPPFLSTIDEMKRSVVPVVCATPKTTQTAELKSIEGSGFFLAEDGTFITANHVLEEMESPKRREPCQIAAVYLPKSGWRTDTPSFDVDFFRFAPKQCNRSKELDIAVCKSSQQLKDTEHKAVPVVLETSSQPDGMPIAFTGFPLKSVIPLTSIGTVSGYKEIIDARGPREIIFDKAAWPGASGSPMYLENGKVVGILLLRGINEGIGHAVGRPSRFIQDFLNDTVKGK